MTAFAQLARTLVNDANLGADAVLLPRAGSNIALRVAFTSREIGLDFGDSQGKTTQFRCQCVVTDAPNIAEGDGLEINGKRYLIRSAEKDMHNIMWKLDLDGLNYGYPDR
jgi:hypothetical protein